MLRYWKVGTTSLIKKDAIATMENRQMKTPATPWSKALKPKVVPKTVVLDQGSTIEISSRTLEMVPRIGQRRLSLDMIFPIS